MEAKLVSKPMSIEDIVIMAYANEIAKDQHLLLRKLKPKVKKH